MAYGIGKASENRNYNLIAILGVRILVIAFYFLIFELTYLDRK